MTARNKNCFKQMIENSPKELFFENGIRLSSESVLAFKDDKRR